MIIIEIFFFIKKSEHKLLRRLLNRILLLAGPKRLFTTNPTPQESFCDIL